MRPSNGPLDVRIALLDDARRKRAMLARGQTAERWLWQPIDEPLIEDDDGSGVIAWVCLAFGFALFAVWAFTPWLDGVTSWAVWAAGKVREWK